MNTQAVQQEPQTTYYRDTRKNPKAETLVHLFDDFWLKVSTHKVYSGSLVTSAHVHKAKGMFEEHRMYTDYSARIEDNKVRVTERAVQTQHERVLLSLEAIKSAALSHTEKVEAKL